MGTERHEQRLSPGGDLADMVRQDMKLGDVTPEALKYPWQRAVELLQDDRGEVRAGAWQWRKLIVTDSSGGFAEVHKVLEALVRTGEEFTVTCWRPGMTGFGPADYRVVLVLWGPYLDMTLDEVADYMEKHYGAGGV